MNIFNTLWSVIAIPLGLIMKYCYIFVDSLLHLPLAYVFAMFLFTVVTKALMFPLSLKQQRQTAISAAYKPFIDEITKKYANDRQKQSEEMAKMQQEYGYSPTAGCLPLLIQFPIIFGLIEVIYRPLTYMIRIPTEVINALTDIVQPLVGTDSTSTRMIETYIIEKVKTESGLFVNLLTGHPDWQQYIDKINDLDMSIGSINLWSIPGQNGAGIWPIVLIPIFSILTMVISTIITMSAAGGTRDKTSMRSSIMMMAVSSVMFAIFSFRFPVGFSLYWGFSNLIIIAQSFLLRKMVNADTIRAEAEEKIRKQKEAKKNARKVVATNEKGEKVVKELSASEMARYRLQKAREIDKERYSNEITESDNAKIKNVEDDSPYSVEHND